MFKSAKQRAFLEGMKHDAKFQKRPQMTPSDAPIPDAAIPALSKLANMSTSVKALAPKALIAPSEPHLPSVSTTLAPSRPMLPPSTSTPLGKETLGKPSKFQGIKSKLKF